MSISGVGSVNTYSYKNVNRSNSQNKGTNLFDRVGAATDSNSHRVFEQSRLTAYGAYCSMSSGAGMILEDEGQSKSEIVVRPDGSRVLMITMSVGGMETTMSLEISKPTKAPNEISKQDISNNMPAAETDAVSDEMSS